MVKKFVKSLLNKIPYVNALKKESDKTKYPSGHFYSSIPDVNFLFKEYYKNFKKTDGIIGINLNIDEQLTYLKEFEKFDDKIKFFEKGKAIRYNINNSSFGYDDGPILNYFLRYIQPKRIIEIGSGNSSACILDTRDNYLNELKITFIDPYPENLKRNLLERDYNTVNIIEKPVQEVKISIFQELKENDILFIDSSHIIKTGSDLQTIFFKILPQLKKGVYIHFHDIRYPFEYYPKLVEQKIYWNEAYFLHSFLLFNDSFKIVFWLNYLLNYQKQSIKLTPLPIDVYNDDYSGGSIWLKKER